MEKVTLIFYPHTKAKSKLSGNIPIYMRVIHKRRKAEIRLDVDCEERLLPLWNPHMMAFEQKNNNVNDRINFIKSEFNKLQEADRYKSGYFSPRELINILVGGRKERTYCIDSIASFVQGYLDNNVKPNGAFTKGTKVNYQKSVNHFFNYLKFNKLEKISLREFDYAKAEMFKIYLMSNYEAIQKKAMTEVSASAIIKKLKVMFGFAEDADIVNKNPFKRVKLTNKSPFRQKLTAEELAKIYFLDLTTLPAMEAYRDIFLFSCFTGLAFGDVISLKQEDIKLSIHGWKLSNTRKKTNNPVEQFLVSYATNILSKYNGNAQTAISNTLFPPRSLQQVNLNLKYLAGLCGISSRLTTHIARHTFRQLLAEAQIEDPMAIDKLMGWSSGGKMSSIYSFVPEIKLIDAQKKFQLYLDKYLQKCLPKRNLKRI